MEAGFIQCVLKFVLGILLVGTGCKESSNSLAPLSDSIARKPALRGRLVFHSYSCYTCNDSRLYLYDFATNTLTELSKDWNITNAMNAHFSPDGKRIVFMGTQGNSNNWDVFIWRIGSVTQPINLTAAFGNTRDEDPKFSQHGDKIVFKQNGKMKEMDTLGNILNTLVVPQAQASMPYYTADDTHILYSGNEVGGTTADIFSVSSSGVIQSLSALPGVEEYYPISRDDTSFLFTRWYSASNHNDQVYLGFFDGRPSYRLPFNETDHDYSDAFPAEDKYIILSSTTLNGKGAYDLYVADMISGNKWPLSLYHPGINSANNELGACYSRQ